MRLLSGLLLALACAASATTARAYPQLALRPGGTPFEGPTDPEVTSLWWNPAALSQLRGVHLYVDGQLLLERGSIQRSPICSTGAPGSCADRTFPATPIDNLAWNGFGGVTWDFRQENLAIGFGVFLPWEQHRSFAGGGGAGSADLPVAYHLRSEDFRTLYFALALAVKLAQKLSIGASVSVVDSWTSLSFDRDTALDGGTARLVASGGYENPSAASRIQARGDGGTLFNDGVIPSPSGLGISLGVLVQPTGWLFLGASWSRMFPFISSGGRFNSGHATGASVTPAADQADRCNQGLLPCAGGSSITYDLPDVWHLGARMKLPHDFELAAWGRVVVYGPYDRNSATREAIVVELSGSAVSSGVAPGRIVLGRGLQPAWGGEVGVRWRPVSSLRLGLSLAGESPSVPREYVSAAALDGPKLDGMFAAELRLRWFRLMAGYELTGLFVGGGRIDPGAFDPSAATRCADARYALAACRDQLEGRALPSNAGDYSLLMHRFSVALGFDY